MNIGMVCYPTYGGSGIVATELGMDLAEKGHQIHFISSSVPARLDVTLPNITFHQVNVQNYPLFQYQPYSLALSSLIVEITKKHGLDVLHAHYAIPHAYAAYMAKQILKEDGYTLPVITTLHGTDITLVGKHPSYKSAVQFSINQSDIVTSVSESLKKDTLEVFDIKKDIRVVPNFIDSQLLDLGNKCQRSKFASGNEKIIIHVSNLRKVKRIQDVIKVFNLIQQKIPAKLIIVGEGPEWDTAERLINKYHLTDKVRNMGQVNDLYSVLKNADLFLLPSEQESFGLAALEAMSAGVPVVSSNAGGIPEVNVDGVTGYVLPVGDVKGMAQKSIELLSDAEKLQTFKKNARERSTQFDKDNILPQYEALYNEAIAQK